VTGRGLLGDSRLRAHGTTPARDEKVVGCHRRAPNRGHAPAPGLDIQVYGTLRAQGFQQRGLPLQPTLSASETLSACAARTMVRLARQSAVEAAMPGSRGNSTPDPDI